MTALLGLASVRFARASAATTTRETSTPASNDDSSAANDKVKSN
jgi:hypothetical protein